MIVIGAGRIGKAFKLLDPNVILISRDENWEYVQEKQKGPILLAVRNDDIEGVLNKVHSDNLDKIVFLQNGMLSPWLSQKGLGSNSRGILYFAVATKGDKPVCGTEQSIFSGDLAEEIVDWLNGIKIPAKKVSNQELKSVEMEKLIWNSAFGVLCDAYGVSVGNVLEKHFDCFKKVVHELYVIAQNYQDLISSEEGLIQNLILYTKTVANYQAATKEWDWRLGWFVSQAQKSNLTMSHIESLRKS